MHKKYTNFIRGIAVTRTGRLGVILTTSAFVCFIFFEMMRMAGVLTNAYVGLIIYLLFPALFILGLLLIPAGWYLYCKQRKMKTRQLLEERFSPDDIKGTGFGSKLFATILGLTVVNILFISIAGFRTLQFMDQPNFCGTACHKVMSPEWVTYQKSPHARVKCVECHVGEGMQAMINSKLSGLRQMVKATLNTYQRPIPTPVHQLRPSRETCEKCHWPEKFYGHRLKVLQRYATDEKTTPKYVTLNLKIDTGKVATKAGIHWHISQENEVRYTSVDDKRNEMLWVKAKQPDGSFKQYFNKNYRDAKKGKDWKNVRVMDCVDCHNRATHIYEDPENAIDERLSKQKFSRALPYAKREMLAAITTNYPSNEAAEEGIAKHLEGFYRRNYPTISGSNLNEIEQMIEVATEIYNRNIHHKMKIQWGTYPSFMGHRHDTGCFRCHNENMRDEKGNMISFDCTLCHSILSYGEDSAFKYLETPNKKSRNYKMHQALREEFLGYTDKK